MGPAEEIRREPDSNSKKSKTMKQLKLKKKIIPKKTIQIGAFVGHSETFTHRRYLESSTKMVTSKSACDGEMFSDVVFNSK